jgi:hypothetical protein
MMPTSPERTWLVQDARRPFTSGLAGMRLRNGYDPIGNRTNAVRDGQAATYSANQLNQYTPRQVPGKVWVIGAAATGATVTVNEQAVTREGACFHKTLNVTNASQAVYQPVSAVGVYNPPGTNDPDVVTVESGKVFVAESPEAFAYDDDGQGRRILFL